MTTNAARPFFATSLLVLSLCSNVPMAAEPAAEPQPMASAEVATISYMAYHPDLSYQLQGIAALEDGKARKALWLLGKSAAYGDKGSQAMIAEMYWQGLGIPVDRALAYAWMDLASSRGSRKLTLLREHYWLHLSAEEQTRALAIGDQVYADYGDHITMPRMQEKLKSFERHKRWSRAMSAGVTTNYLVGLGGGRIKVDKFGERDSPHWNPELYLKWRDDFFENPGGAHVDVGDLEPVPAGFIDSQQ